MKTTDLRAVFNVGKEILKNGGVESYSFDTALLFEHFFGISKAELLLNTDIKSEKDTEPFLGACKRRAGGYPLQYILGKWEFYGYEFTVSEQVLIPRADTETLIDYVIKNYSGELRILDMCCGSGCIGITLKKLIPSASVTLCDISEGALEISRINAKRLSADVKIERCDLLDGYGKYFEKETFDIIISNPPYIKDGEKLDRELDYEPKTALFGGRDGLDFYRALITDWFSALKPHGEMILESGYDTSNDIIALFTENGGCDIQTAKDFNGITRMVSAKRGKHI